MKSRGAGFARTRTLALAHELRTPLTSLALATGLLQEERFGPLRAEQRELVDTMARDLDRLRLLVDRELRTDHLGIHAGPVERTEVDLALVVEKVLPPLRVQTKANLVELVENLERGTRVIGDAAKLGWVAASLVGNALRFAPAHSKVRVAVVSRASRCELRVTDAGPGVPAERRRDIFARQGGGTLFLAREIVDAHGGELRLSSRAGRGATFAIILPRARPTGTSEP